MQVHAAQQIGEAEARNASDRKLGIKELLRTGPVCFVVADCGMSLRWIPTHERFTFWKDIEPNIAHHEQRTPIHLEQFPNEIAYAASQWCGGAGEYAVLLEKRH